MFVLGTAGHVDHGKSTLIEALTGISVDRLPEEKRRGMTIEPNFAWFETDNGTVGIVDIPGHKRFIKNMVMGADQVDAFFFVVAADDGWMPQTEEHLRILESFGIARGVAVITKTDLVHDDRTKEITDLVSTRLSDTFGKKFKVLPFRKDRPELAAAIREAMERELETIPKSLPNSKTRLWVDRSFSPKGLGLIVAGTLREGRLKNGDKLIAWPSDELVTIRGIESYKKRREEASPVSRVALQLSRGSVGSIPRGSLLSTEKAELVTQIEGSLKFFGKEVLKNTRMKFYVGSLEVDCTVIPLKKTGVFRIRFKKRVPIRIGDRFLVRLFGEERTVAGGTVHSIGRNPAPSQTKEPTKKSQTPIVIGETHRKVLDLFVGKGPQDVSQLPRQEVEDLIKEKMVLILKWPFVIGRIEYQGYVSKIVDHLKKKTSATTSELKEVLGLSRKPAMLILEKMDDERITYLKDNVRKLLR